jgi:hypothetical protein
MARDARHMDDRRDVVADHGNYRRRLCGLLVGADFDRSELMLDRTKFDCQDERFADTIEHRSTMATRALTNAAKALFEISQTTEGRDALIEELAQISEAALAVQLVWSRVRAREQA